MTDNRGVFFLNEVQQDASTGDWVPLSTVFIQTPFDSSAGPNTGYFAGGPSTTVVDKVNYTNDTTARVPTADLPFAQDDGNASSSLTAGYFAGGNPGMSQVNKCTYATDTTSRIPTADLSDPRHGLAGTGSSSSGYFVSGYSNPAGGVVTRTDKLTYASDTTAAAPGADVSVARYYMEGTGDSSNGYVAGGYAPGPDATKSVLDKIVFAADVSARVPGGNLTLARYGLAATGNGPAGYFSGGINPGGGKSTTDKCTYSSETMAEVPGAAMSSARYYVAGTSSSTAGYLGGGLQSTARTIMDKLNYSTEGTARVPGADLTGSGNRNAFATSAKANAIPFTTNPVSQYTTGLNPYPNLGYTLGGGAPYTNIIQKFDADTETVSTPTATMPTVGGFNSSEGTMTAGYSFAGQNPASPAQSYTQKIVYATESVSSTGNLTAARYGTTSVSSDTNAYVSGGYSPALVSRTDKFTYSSDTAAYVPGANLSDNLGYQGSAGTPNVGYIGGGYDKSFFSKITYSSDTAALSPSVLSLHAGSGHRSASAIDASYFYGGASANNTYCQKLVFSTESFSSVPSGTSTKATTGYPYRISNNNYGYFLGGYSPQTSQCAKLTIESETCQNIPATISSARYNSMASSPRSYGRTQPPQATPTPQFIPAVSDADMYSASGPSISSFEKFTTVTETGSLVTGANTTVNGATHTTFVGSKTEGFVSGGVNNAFSGTDRITYSTGSVGRVPGMDMIPSSNPYFYAATPVATESLGYLMGGQGPSNPGNESFVQKLDYSAETAGRVPSADMPSPRRYGNNLGSTTNGYLVAGSNSGGGVTTVMYTDTVKLNYSTESCSALPASPLPTWGTSYSNGTGVTNPSHGYFNAPQPSSKNSTSIFKFTLSTETNAIAPGATLSAVQYACQAGGDHTSGYFGGGRTPGFSDLTTMTKVTFSTDTTSNSPGNLVVARQRHSSRSTADQGMPAPTVNNPVNC